MSNRLRRTIAVALALALAASPAMAQSATIAPGAIQTLGCYSSVGTLTKFGDATGQSSGYCRGNCTSLPDPALVMATSGGVSCYCGNELPALDQLVDDSKCNVKCMGYGLEDGLLPTLSHRTRRQRTNRSQQYNQRFGIFKFNPTSNCYKTW